MAQFDVYKNNNQTSSELFPYLLDIQNDLLSKLKTRVVVPLAANMTPAAHLNPVFEIDGTRVAMSTADIAGVPLSVCGETVTSLSKHRNQIIDAVDFLLNGF